MQMFSRVLLGSVALSASVLFGTVSQPAIGQELSPGCQLVNRANTDKVLVSISTGTVRQFFSGETITIAAGTPTTATPTTVTLVVDEASVDTAAFPGEVSYTFPADAMATVTWLVDGNATFSARCELGLPTSTNQCQKGGYASFGFKNQGDCLSFVATHGKNEPGKNIPSSAPNTQ